MLKRFILSCRHKHFVAEAFRLLLKQLFEVIFQSSTDYEKKLNMLMIVSKSLENHSLAVDKEINFFSALISLSKAF